MTRRRRGSLRIDLRAEPAPDETTVCKFRHLLEEHNLGEEILGTVNLHLQAKGVRITTGHHRGCDPDSRPQFDQKPTSRARKPGSHLSECSARD